MPIKHASTTANRDVYGHCGWRAFRQPPDYLAKMACNARRGAACTPVSRNARWASPAAAPDSPAQQAAVMAQAASDCFNWGYDPLHFTDTKPYRDRLEKAREATGLNDAVIVCAADSDGFADASRPVDHHIRNGFMEPNSFIKLGA